MAGALSRFSACATYEKGGRSLFKEPATHRSTTAYSDLAKGFCPFGVFLTYKSTQASAANILYPEDPVCGDSQASSEKTEEVHHAKRKESKSCFYPFRVPDSAHLSMGHTAAVFIRHGGREQHAISYHQLCLAMTLFVAFCLWIGLFSKYRNIPLGPDGAKPEYSKSACSPCSSAPVWA